MKLCKNCKHSIALSRGYPFGSAQIDLYCTKNKVGDLKIDPVSGDMHTIYIDIYTDKCKTLRKPESLFCGPNASEYEPTKYAWFWTKFQNLVRKLTKQQYKLK